MQAGQEEIGTKENDIAATAETESNPTANDEEFARMLQVKIYISFCSLSVHVVLFYYYFFFSAVLETRPSLDPLSLSPTAYKCLSMHILK